MPLRVFIFCVLLCMMVLAGCNEDGSKDQKATDSLEYQVTTDTMLRELKGQEQLYADWKQYYQQQTSGFAIDSFEQQETIGGDLLTRPVELTPEFYDRYAPLLVYNGDSSMFIDPFSYSLIVERKENKRVARGGEADQEVAVVDPKSKERSRIFFCGPPCTIVKAIWMDKTHIALFGLSSEDGIESYKPMIWIADITTGSTTAYNYSVNALNTVPADLLRHILAQQGIEMEY